MRKPHTTTSPPHALLSAMDTPHDVAFRYKGLKCIAYHDGYSWLAVALDKYKIARACKKAMAILSLIKILDTLLESGQKTKIAPPFFWRTYYLLRVKHWTTGAWLWNKLA